MSVKDSPERIDRHDTEEDRTEEGKSKGKILENMGTAVAFAEGDLQEKARQYLEVPSRTVTVGQSLEDLATAVAFAEGDLQEEARQYLEVPSRTRTVGQSLEDSFVAGAFAEGGAHEVAQEYMESHPPLAGRVYGDIVYWGTVAATILTIIGQVVSFVSKSTFMAPSYVLSSIWQQESVEQIWKGAIGHLPQGHWYLKHLGTGPGITEMSLAFGVFIVIPALVGSGFILFSNRDRLFGSLAMSAALITIVSMVGLLPLPVG